MNDSLKLVNNNWARLGIAEVSNRLRTLREGITISEAKLAKENGNIYKYDDNGIWMLANSLQMEVDGANFQINLITDWSDGNIFVAESYLRDGVFSGGTMMTHDVVNGSVSEKFYDAIGVEAVNDGFRAYRYEPDEE